MSTNYCSKKWHSRRWLCRPPHGWATNLLAPSGTLLPKMADLTSTQRCWGLASTSVPKNRAQCEVRTWQFKCLGPRVIAAHTISRPQCEMLYFAMIYRYIRRGQALHPITVHRPVTVFAQTWHPMPISQDNSLDVLMICTSLCTNLSSQAQQNLLWTYRYIYPVTMVSVGYHCGLSVIYRSLN